MHFSITGEYLTTQFRAMIQNGLWKDAFNGLKEALEGITSDQVISVLRGEKKLIGVNNIDIIDDNSHLNPNFIEDQYFYYFGDTLFLNKNLYKIYGYVRNLSTTEYCLSRDVLRKPYLSNNDLSQYDKNLFFIEMNKQRAKYYLQSPRDIVYFENTKCFLLKENTVDIPFWLSQKDIVNIYSIINYDCDFYVSQFDFDEHEELNQIITTSNTSSNNTFPQKSNTYLQENDSKEEEFLNAFEKEKPNYLKLIKDQAEKTGGWLKFKYNNEIFTLPKAAFEQWSLKDRSKNFILKRWNPICPPNIKMNNDDPVHTDWWLCTGKPIEEAYDKSENSIMDFFYQKRYEIQKKYSNNFLMKLSNLSNHKGFEKSQIFHYSKNMVIEPNSVIIIPNASANYESLAYECAKKNVVLITETGGKLCHLAIIGREYSLTLYMFPDALSLIPHKSFCNIDLEKEKIELI